MSFSVDRFGRLFTGRLDALEVRTAARHMVVTKGECRSGAIRCSTHAILGVARGCAKARVYTVGRSDDSRVVLPDMSRRRALLLLASYESVLGYPRSIDHDVVEGDVVRYTGCVVPELDQSDRTASQILLCLGDD